MPKPGKLGGNWCGCTGAATLLVCTDGDINPAVTGPAPSIDGAKLGGIWFMNPGGMWPPRGALKLRIGAPGGGITIGPRICGAMSGGGPGGGIIIGSGPAGGVIIGGCAV